MLNSRANRLSLLLAQPYPLATATSEKIALALSCGLFVAFFLLVFQPFHLDLLRAATKFLAIVSYGLITTLCMLFNDILLKNCFPTLFQEDNWTIKKQLLWFIYQLLFISIANHIFSTILGLVPFSSAGFFFFLAITLAVGIFPVAIITIANYLRLLRKNSRIAAAIYLEKPALSPAPPETITLTADNGKDQISFAAPDLLFITSQENYSTLFLMQAGVLRKELIRGSLVRWEQQIQSNLIRRCHRSFVVNLHQVVRVSGNAQGYNLHFTQTESVVPVSRKYSPEILPLLNKG